MRFLRPAIIALAGAPTPQAAPPWTTRQLEGEEELKRVMALRPGDLETLPDHLLAVNDDAGEEGWLG